jgi:hypothetical protein
MFKKLLAVLLLFASPAFGQTVTQSGIPTRGHVPYWVTSGVIGDGGSATDSPITSIGVTNNGSAGFCVSSDRQSAAGRNQLCFGASTSGAATISVQNYGTALAQNLNFIINGVTVVFPGGGTVGMTLATETGPFIVNHASCFSNTSGNLVDCNFLSLAAGGTGAGTAPTARTSLGLGTIATQNANAVAITGGAITGLPTPVNPTDAAIKSYVDSTATGLIILPSSGLATTTILPNTPTYSNGASGVGATLTAGSNSTLTVDGTVATLNAVVLVKNQASAFQNGIYTVTTAGSGAAAWVLTRATYFNQSTNMLAGSYTLVTGGATLTGNSYVLQATITTVGTTSVNFNPFTTSGVVSFNSLTGSIVTNQVVQPFTAGTGTYTYTPTSGMLHAVMECVGNGGGAGGAAGSLSTTFAGGGGGSGSYSRKTVTAAQVGATATIVIGAIGNGGATGGNNGSSGGNITITSAASVLLLQANGGSGGLFGSVAQSGQGGAGGATGTGDIIGQGNPGMPGIYSGSSSVLLPSGNGASSAWGGGALGVQIANGSTSGNNGNNYGGGGSGGETQNTTSTAAGGNGSSGACFITDFVNI